MIPSPGYAAAAAAARAAATVPVSAVPLAATVRLGAADSPVW